jgi:hypothetical protein
MRKPLLIVAAIAVLPLFAAHGAPAASYKSCSGGFNPDGSKGSFYRKIRAKGTSCATARSVTKAWVKYEAMHDGANPTAKVTIKGYKCAGKSVKSSGYSDGALSVLCTKGTAAIRFTGSP